MGVSGDRAAVSVMFSDDLPFAATARAMCYRVFGGRSRWHNRVFSARQSLERTADGFTVRWRGRGEFRARRIDRLPCLGPRAAILASGPSVARLERPERLFRVPVACVNGSVSLPGRLGRRCAYLIVSDPRFIRDKPDLFRTGAALADAVVLDPSTAFAALQHAPDAVTRAEVYLVEDVLHPFKRPRPRREALAADPRLIVHAGGRLAFSLDPSFGICPAGTVVYTAVQVLFGIGYRDLVMFGVDLSDGPRFYAETSRAPSDLADAFSGSIAPAFELVGEYLRRSGRTLVNASPGSRLSAADVPKADGNDVLATLGREAA